ncbi:hypothetical protein B0H13DRAFT_2356180 [Mycena leptocephala]|nr:hypothetical protein B0H13DRAFT_2356180 [Mycena leptocephala]
MPIASWIGLRHNQPRFHALCCHLRGQLPASRPDRNRWNCCGPSLRAAPVPARSPLVSGFLYRTLRPRPTGTSSSRPRLARCPSRGCRTIMQQLPPPSSSSQTTPTIARGHLADHAQPVDEGIEVQNEMGMEGGGDVATALSGACAWRWAWTYVLIVALALALALGPVLPVIERGWFLALASRHPGAGAHDGRRGGYLYARKERGHLFSPLARSPSSWSAAYGCSERMRTSPPAGYNFKCGRACSRVRGGWDAESDSECASFLPSRVRDRAAAAGWLSVSHRECTRSFEADAAGEYSARQCGRLRSSCTFLLSPFSFRLIVPMFASYPDTHPPSHPALR